MAPIIRLKRRLEDEPISAIVLNCKRRKINDNVQNTEDEIKTVLQFAGTVQKQDEDITPHISKLNKSELEQSFKQHKPDVLGKVRQLTADASRQNRFKVVNLSRSIKEDSDSCSNDKQYSLTVVDVESEPKVTESTNSAEESDIDYVYDLYYTNSDDIGDSELDNIFSVCAADDLVYGSYRDNGISEESEPESEDSNDENNWRNDYPDEDEINSVDENEMQNAMDDLDVGNDLSSDNEEEGFVYSIDSEAAGFEEDLDQTDVRRYGELYARFKAKQKKEEERYNKDIYDDDDSDNDDDYYDN